LNCEGEVAATGFHGVSNGIQRTGRIMRFDSENPVQSLVCVEDLSSTAGVIAIRLPSQVAESLEVTLDKNAELSEVLTCQKNQE
jgi:hypothetical protein